MRIVITGASGNVGTALLAGLRETEHRLAGVSRRPPQAGAEPYDRATWHIVDLSRPEAQAQLGPIFSGADVVVHLAWGFQPSRDSGYLHRLGVGGTRAVIGAAATAHVGHIVHMSSVGAYSPKTHDTPVTESWPTEGIRTLPYSRDKSTAERVLDEFEATSPDTVVTRLRPGLIIQRAAGSALLRYGAPGWLPSSAVRHLPAVPVDDSLIVPIVHATDVAEAIVRVIDRRAGGAFNLAADPPVTGADIARALDARSVPVPPRVLRAAVELSWRLRVQSLDPGWLDLAFAVPLVDTTRAHKLLDWQPRIDARTALSETVDGMASAASSASPALRRRTIRDELTSAIRRGGPGRRQRT